MVNKLDKNLLYKSPIAIPPGETVLEAIQERGMSQVDLATRMGRTPKFVTELVGGKSSITIETALALEQVLGIPASFWLSLESNYQETLARLNEDGSLKKELPEAEKFPYSEMAKFGWVPQTKSALERARNLLSYFGVTSFDNIIERQKISTACYYRISRNHIYSFPSILAWLRKGDIESMAVETKDFDKNKLEEKLNEIKSYSLCAPGEFQSKVSSALAECGVALVMTPNLPKAPISAAARWLTKDKALIQLTIRYKFWDILWFNLFHEIGHIVLHSKKLINVDFQKNIDGDDEEEMQANNFAANALIPKDNFKKFRDEGNFSESKIKSFASTINIHPSIILGRLQHEKLVSYKHCAHLRPRVEWLKN